MPFLSLGNDALLEVLSFVPVGDCASASAASRALRGSTTSQALARTRGSGEYVLRGRGVVHSLATAFGTRPWATDEDPSYGTHPMVPRQLKVASNVDGCWWNDDPDEQKTYDELGKSFKWKAVAQPLYVGTDSIACGPGVGTFVEYELPFQLRVGSFQIGFGCCSAGKFRDWVLEALNPEQDATADAWQVLFDSGGRSPWPGLHSAIGPVQTFHLDAPFEASRFRICTVRREVQCFHIRSFEQCFHIRSFELFGAILPPWSL